MSFSRWQTLIAASTAYAVFTGSSLCPGTVIGRFSRRPRKILEEAAILAAPSLAEHAVESDAAPRPLSRRGMPIAAPAVSTSLRARFDRTRREGVGRPATDDHGGHRDDIQPARGKGHTARRPNPQLEGAQRRAIQEGPGPSVQPYARNPDERHRGRGGNVLAPDAPKHARSRRTQAARADAAHRAGAAEGHQLADPRRREHDRGDARLRAARGRPHGLARPARARSVLEAGLRLRAARGLRSLVPLREPLRADRREEGQRHLQRPDGNYSGPTDDLRASPSARRDPSADDRARVRAAIRAERSHHRRRGAADDELLHDDRQPLSGTDRAGYVPGDRTDRGATRHALRFDLGSERELAREPRDASVARVLVVLVHDAGRAGPARESDLRAASQHGDRAPAHRL